MTTTSPASIVAVGDCAHRVLLVVEDLGGALKDRLVDAGRLDHGALWRQRPFQDREPAGRVDRGRDRVENLSVRRRRVEPGKVLSHGLTGDGQGVAMQQTGVEQLRMTTGTPPMRSMSFIT